MPKLYNPDGTFREVDHINFYLLPGPDIYVKPRTLPLSRAVPPMTLGNVPRDDGNFILSEDEKNYFVKKYPHDEKFVRQFMGAEDFIHNKKRYCLWLVDATPDDIRRNKFIYERVKAVKEFRLNSTREGTRKAAETPHLFSEIRQPTSNYILVPNVSSEKRQYIPIDYVDKNIICSNANSMIPDTEIWHFGILTSKVHMIWTKTVCGRLRNDLRYSAKIVYNNFVWVKMEFIDYAELILAAEKILKIRKKYLVDSGQGTGNSENEKTVHYPLSTSHCSLADLYDDLTMPKDLREAHREVDKIVMRMYRLDEDMSDEDIAIALLEHYKFVTDYLRENNLKQLTRQNSDDEDFDDE